MFNYSHKRKFVSKGVGGGGQDLISYFLTDPGIVDSCSEFLCKCNFKTILIAVF